MQLWLAPRFSHTVERATRVQGSHRHTRSTITSCSLSMARRGALDGELLQVSGQSPRRWTSSPPPPANPSAALWSRAIFTGGILGLRCLARLPRCASRRRALATCTPSEQCAAVCVALSAPLAAPPAPGSFFVFLKQRRLGPGACHCLVGLVYSFNPTRRLSNVFSPTCSVAVLSLYGCTRQRSQCSTVVHSAVQVPAVQ